MSSVVSESRSKSESEEVNIDEKKNVLYFMEDYFLNSVYNMRTYQNHVSTFIFKTYVIVQSPCSKMKL